MYAMLCYAMLCYVLCYAMLCYAILYYVMTYLYVYLHALFDVNERPSHGISTKSSGLLKVAALPLYCKQIIRPYVESAPRIMYNTYLYLYLY